MKNSSTLKLLAGLSLVAVLVGCVQLPTEKAGIADMRPQISFRVANEDPSLQGARVYVNGLDAGQVGDYADGKAALRILPGRSTIKVTAGSRTVIDEQVYLGDGVGRTFLVK